jgi:hypothetical protein
MTAAAATSGAAIRLTPMAAMGITHLEARVTPPPGGGEGATAATSSGRDRPDGGFGAPAPLSAASSIGTAQATSTR